jgi:hypothetical protein
LAGGSAALLASTARGQAVDDEVDNRLSYSFRSIRQHEADHVEYLLDALGNKARPMPSFRGLVMQDFDQFMLVAQALENTGAGAYLGAADSIESRDILGAAGSIALIEARHASYLNVLQEQAMTANTVETLNPSFESALTADQVVGAAGSFIRSLNGGPPIAYSDRKSGKNDIAILNYALALEFLESEFYRVNVRRFF